MGRKALAKIETASFEVSTAKVKGLFAGTIRAEGNSFYLKLDPSFMRFWNLLAGDELLVSVLKAKRITSKST